MNEILYKNGSTSMGKFPVVMACISVIWVYIFCRMGLQFMGWYDELLGDNFDYISATKENIISLVIAILAGFYNTILFSKPVIGIKNGAIRFPGTLLLDSGIPQDSLKSISLRNGDEGELYFDVTLTNGLKRSFCTKGYFGEHQVIRSFIYKGIGVIIK
jgi:hypothetical protein